MRILLISPILPPEIGGPATYITKIYQHLTKQHQVKILGFCSTYPSKIGNSIPIALSTQGSMIIRQCSLAVALFFTSLFQDVLYVQGALSVGFLTTIIGKLLGKPVIVKFVGDEAWEYARQSGKTTLDLERYYAKEVSRFDPRVLIERFVFGTADRIITPSHYLAQFLQQVHAVSPDKITVLYNAVDVPFDPETKKNPYLVLCVGRLVAWKQVSEVIDAVVFARNEKHLPLELLIIGDGPERVKLELQIQNLGNPSWLSLAGSLSQLETRSYIAQADRLVLYSRYEGLSHTILEAMKLNTWVIASEITPNKEALGQHGRLIPLNQSEHLVSALQERVTPQQRIEARQFADGRYSWVSHLDGLYAMLESLS